MADILAKTKRIVFLDYLRVIAIFMVLLVHCCEAFYLREDGAFHIASLGDAHWVSLLDSACRSAVPLFAMASAYLLFPVTKPTGAFLKHRILRVGIPFLIWACLYNAWNGGTWASMLFNFPLATGGHLWFVPMIIGLYLTMPLLSPWAEKVTKRELQGWLGVWFFTTLFPYLRYLWGHLYGAPSYGVIPYLYGECPWNSFGTFQYASGFIGYVLMGFYLRKFVPALTWKRTLSIALPLWLAGYALAFGFFFGRIPDSAGYPVTKPYAMAVILEMSWEFCSIGIVCTTLAYFLVIRKFTAAGGFHQRVVRPLAEASYGVYLIHIFVLVPVVGALRQAGAPTPVTIIAGALIIFLISSAIAWAGRKIPRLGKWFFG